MTLRQYIKVVRHEIAHWPDWKRELAGVRKCKCKKQRAAHRAGGGGE